MHTRSRSLNRIVSPRKKPLLRMLWWVSVAPLGKPVVPLVNWMLIGSSNCNSAARSASRLALGGAGAIVNRIEAQRPRHLGRADGDHKAQIGQARRAQAAG